MATKEIGRGIGYNIGTDRGIVPSRFGTDFGELRRSVQSSQTPSDYYGITGKKGTTNGGVQQTVLVIDRGSNIAQAERAVQKSLQLIKGRSGQSPLMERIPFRAYEGKGTFYGKEAKEALRKAIEDFGGKITKVKGDELTYTYALAESEVQRHMKAKHSPSRMFEQSAFREARKLSDSFHSAELQKQQAKEQKEADKQKEKQRVKEEKERLKEERDSLREKNAFNKALIAQLIVITAIARRILTSVLALGTRAQEIRKDAVEARNYGIPYTRVREYGYYDKMRGLEEGTTLEAVADVVDKFGDLKNIDTTALEKLALVLGSDIKNLVNLGLGKSDPDALRKMIEEGFFKSFTEGKNDLGMVVGQERARQELLTVLRSISPAMAKSVAEAMDSYMSGKYAVMGFNTMGERQALMSLNPFGLSSFDTNVLPLLGVEVNELKSTFSKLNEYLKDQFSLGLSGVVRVLNKFMFHFEDETAKIQANIQTQKLVEENIGTLSLASKNTTDMVRSGYKALTGKDISEKTLKALLKGDVSSLQGLSNKEGFGNFLKNVVVAQEAFAEYEAFRKVQERANKGENVGAELDNLAYMLTPEYRQFYLNQRFNKVGKLGYNVTGAGMTALQTALHTGAGLTEEQKKIVQSAILGASTNTQEAMADQIVSFGGGTALNHIFAVMRDYELPSKANEQFKRYFKTLSDLGGTSADSVKNAKTFAEYYKQLKADPNRKAEFDYVQSVLLRAFQLTLKPNAKLTSKSTFSDVAWSSPEDLAVSFAQEYEGQFLEWFAQAFGTGVSAVVPFDRGAVGNLIGRTADDALTSKIKAGEAKVSTEAIKDMYDAFLLSGIINNIAGDIKATVITDKNSGTMTFVLNQSINGKQMPQIQETYKAGTIDMNRTNTIDIENGYYNLNNSGR